MKKKKFLLCLLVLAVIFAVATGMVACNKNPAVDPDDDDGGDTPPPHDDPDIVNTCLSAINDGLVNSISLFNDENDPLVEYSVDSTYTLYTRYANYTITYRAIYDKDPSQSRYYIKVFDNIMHITRTELFYDATDLYLYTEGGDDGKKAYVVTGFNSMLLYNMFDMAAHYLDLKDYLFSQTMVTYFAYRSVLYGFISPENTKKLSVGSTGMAITFSDIDASMLVSTANAVLSSRTDGIGTGFDAVTNRLLGFRLSKLCEFTLNSISLEHIRFLFEEGDVYGIDGRVEGRMLDGSDYFIDVNYKYDTTTKTLPDGQTLRKTYTFEDVSLSKGSYEGTAVFPTIREEEYRVSADYDLDPKVNANNRFTFRIYDKITDDPGKYDGINEFLSAYYDHETLYINAEGLCNAIGSPIALESLHLPKVYLTDVNVSSFLQVMYNYAIRVVSVLFDFEARQATENNKHLYASLMDAVESTDDLSTVRFTVTEALIKDIREDDTNMSVLLCRLIGVEDDTIERYFGTNPFQYMTVIASYNFVTGKLTFDNYYGTQLYATFDLYRTDYNGIILPDDLNELYYTAFIQPDVVALQYDVTIAPYGVQTIDLSRFFGVFIQDSTGKNTPYLLDWQHRLAIRGQVSERMATDVSGARKATTSVDLKFYKQKVSDGGETLLLSLVTNPYDLNELLVGFYMPLGGYGNADGLFYRIDKDTVSEELNRLTGENNMFASESNLAILMGLTASLGGNATTYIENKQYCINIMTDEKNDPVYNLTGIADTYTLAKIKVGFRDVDLSGVSQANYGYPTAEKPEDMSVRSVYSAGSAWRKTNVFRVNGKELSMQMTYTEDSTAVVSGKNEYHPEARLFGLTVTYRVNILQQTGTYVIFDILASKDKVNATDKYTIVKTGLPDTEETALPQYLMVIDPSYTKKLPTAIEVRYDNYETGEADCAVSGFFESNIVRDGYNLALLAGEYDGMPSYTLKIGDDSIASVSFDIYIAVACRSVVPLRVGENGKEPEKPDDNITAVINGAVESENVMGAETLVGENVYAVINGITTPVIGVINVDPYTFAMTRTLDAGYDLIADGISSQQMRLTFNAFYGTMTEVGEHDERIERNKYYNKEGYNYFYLEDIACDWTFDATKITWQGGVYYAYGYYGDVNDGYAVQLAIRVVIMKKKVNEVRIDEEGNSTYTIDYLVASTYVIPTTGGDGHKITIVFDDGTERQLIPTRLGSISTEDYYTKYLVGTLDWAGASELKDKITLAGTSSLFGTGKDATQVTTAVLGGERLSVGDQTIGLTVLQPSRYQSGSEEKTKYLVTSYTVDDDGGKITTTPTYGQVAISYAKFAKSDDVSGDNYAVLEMNPYDFAAALPETIWLYVYTDSVQREWKEYKVNWTETDKDGQFIHLIREKDGRFVLAYPSTEKRDLVVYGKVGDGNGSIWVTMVVRNLNSELQSADFFSYSYQPQTVRYGTTIGEEDYYEYIENGYALTQDEDFVEGKDYYLKDGKSFVLQTVKPSDDIGQAMYYEKVVRGYGLTEDEFFENGKTYYTYVETKVTKENTISVDPYAPYDSVIPTRFVAVLGSGAVVTSEDVDEDGVRTGLVWYVLLPGDSNEYPLVYSDEYSHLKTVRVSGVYYNRYDENGRFIFPYNAGSDCALKCYISGVGGTIANEVVLPLAVQGRTVKSYSDSTHEGLSYVDIFNDDEDIYTDADDERSLFDNGIYGAYKVEDGEQKEKAAPLGYTAIDLYKKFSTAVVNRLATMSRLGASGRDVFVGVQFSSSTQLYSLPVRWNDASLRHLISVLSDLETLTEAELQQGGVSLRGTICAGTVNEQAITVFFSVRSVSLSSVTFDNSLAMTGAGVVAVRNDSDAEQDAACTLTIAEMNHIRDGAYNYGEEYLTYLASDNPSENYTDSTYKYIIVFDLERSYALSDNRNGYFCTPFEYMTYLFSSLTLGFTGGGDGAKATAAGKIGLLTPHSGLSSTIGSQRDKLITYFNESVLGLHPNTLISDAVGNVLPFTYSFLELGGFSEGSAVCNVLLVVRARRADKLTEEQTDVPEVFNEDLSQAYGGGGYSLPSYVGIEYEPVTGGYVAVEEGTALDDDKFYFVHADATGYVYDPSATGIAPRNTYFEYRNDGEFVRSDDVTFVAGKTYYLYDYVSKQYVAADSVEGETTEGNVYYTFAVYNGDHLKTVYTANYETKIWNVSNDKNTTDALGSSPLTYIRQDRLDVMNGALYKFYYVLPCSNDNFALNVRIPQKRIGSSGYSAEGDLYPIVNGVIEIDNPFRFVTYDAKTAQFVIDETLIPRRITVNADNPTYTETMINSYEIDWTFHYTYVDETTGETKNRLTASLFETGADFIFGTFSFYAYSTRDSETGSYVVCSPDRNPDCTLELRLKIAKLSFYGLEAEGLTVIEEEQAEAGQNVKQNTVEIDPYGADSNGTFNLPTDVTVLFNSEFTDGATGKRVLYSFTNVRFSTTTTRTSVSTVTYNQFGLSETFCQTYGIDNGNVAPLLMNILIGSGSGNNIKYFGDGVPVNVAIRSRIIDTVQVENTVYDDGKYASYAFNEVSVEGGKPVTPGVYYEYADGYYTVTSDTTFMHGKTYYLHASVSVFEKDETVESKKAITGVYYEYVGNRFVRTADSNFIAGKTYYYRREADVNDASGKIYYVAVSAYEKAKGNFESGTAYYKAQKANVEDGAPVNGEYFRYYEGYENGTYVTGGTYARVSVKGDMSSTYTHGVSHIMGVYRYIPSMMIWVDAQGEIYDRNETYGEISPIIVSNKEDGDKLDDGICRLVYYYASVAATEDGFVETNDSSARQDKEYFIRTEKTGFVVGKEIVGEVYEEVDSTFVRAIGSYVEGHHYYTFARGAYGMGVYERTKIQRTFDEGDYYISVQKTDYVVGDLIGDGVFVRSGNRYEKADLSAKYVTGQSYYTFRSVRATVGYYLDEEYYETSGDRFVLTEDVVFRKTKTYYVFRPITVSPAGSTNGYAVGKPIPKDVYLFFEGYEATVFYAYATRPIGEDVRYLNDSKNRQEYEMPVYYIDPYNTASFRLPTEVNIHFTSFGDGVYQRYKVRGWTLYNESATVGARYTELPVYGRDSVASSRFYSVLSADEQYYYAYFNPSEDDYKGATYLLAGYISVGTSRQYFYVVVVVLNRSLTIGEELDRSYTVTFDFADPVGAMLTDIPVAMEEDMFVLYNSYYIRFSLYGKEYSVNAASLYSYNNGNNPYIPTVIWKDEYNDGQTVYNFDALLTTGYSGKLYGNVAAEDLNFPDLYDMYYYGVYTKYKTLIESGMWDRFFTESYVSNTKDALAELQTQLDDEVVFYAYEMLCKNYKYNTDQTAQQYYGYITETYLNEATLRMEDRTIDLKKDEDRRRAIVFMYSILREDVRESTGSSGRKQIFDDWTQAIADFRTERYSVGSDADSIRSDTTEYQKLKAAYYAKMVNGNNFRTDEQEKNNALYVRLSRSLTDCINRDVWDLLAEYEDSSIRNLMTSLYVPGESETNAKSNALRRLIAAKKPTARGEETVAEVNMPKLTYSQIVDDDGEKVTSIDFNLFSYDSLEESFNVQFIVSYADYYRVKEKEAEDDITAMYRLQYAEVTLEELVNILMEGEIDGITPYETSGVTSEAKLSFMFGTERKVFSYDTYMDALRTLAALADTSGNLDTTVWTRTRLYEYLDGKDATVGTGGERNYYAVNTALWDALVAYYADYAIKPIPNDYTAEKWNGLKDYYFRASQSDAVTYPTVSLPGRTVEFAHEVGGRTYTEYNALMYALMSAYTEAINTQQAFETVTGWAQTYYPDCWELQQYYDYQQSQVYYLVADGLLETGRSGIYRSVHDVYDRTNENRGTTNVFVDMYTYSSDGDGFDFALGEMLYRWESLKNNREIALETDYSKAFKEMIDHSSDDNASTAYMARYYIATGNNLTLQRAATAMADFLTGYVVNTGATAYDNMMTYLGSVSDRDNAYPFTASEIASIENLVRGGDTVVGSLYRGSGDFNSLAPSLYELYGEYEEILKGRFGFGSAEELIDELVRFLVCDGLKKAWEDALSVDVNDAAAKSALDLTDVWTREAGVAVKTAAINRLMRKNSEISDLLYDFFRNPSSTYHTYTAMYCVPSLAFSMLLESKEKQGEIYIESRDAFRDDYIADNIYNEAYGILENMYRDMETELSLIEEGGSIGTYTSRSHAYYYYYKAFLQSAGKQKAYDEWVLKKSTATGEEALVPGKFVGQNTDKLNVDVYFAGKAVGGKTEEYLRDYPLRAILYYYESIANDIRKNIVKEVARLYIGEMSFTESNLVSAVRNGTLDGQIFFADLLCRPDLGSDGQADLRAAYYHVFLTEGMNMIAFSTSRADDRTSHFDAYRSYLSRVIDYDQATQRDFLESVSSRKYAIGLQAAIEKWYDSYAAAATDALGKDCVGLLYDVFYADSRYQSMMDSVLEYIVKTEDTSGPKYSRVLNILRECGFSGYPTIGNYYYQLFEVMQDNLIEEETSLFTDAVRAGIERQAYGEIYDRMRILTMTSSEFAKTVLTYLGLENYDASLLRTTSVRVFLATIGYESNTELVYRVEQGESHVWWDELGFGLDEEERRVLKAVYQQQRYASYTEDNTDLVAYAASILQVYNFLYRVEEYRDAFGEYAGRKPLERSFLTTENILNNDYSEVTVAYKYYLIDLMMRDETFMAGINGGNSMTLAQRELQRYFGEYITARKDAFAEIAGFEERPTETDEESIAVICEALLSGAVRTDVDMTAWRGAIESAMEVISHTSAYVHMSVGADNPLKTYIDGVVKRIADGTASERDTVFGKLSLGYYVEKCTTGSVVDYEKLLRILLDEVGENETEQQKAAHRVVTETFWSADKANVTDDEQKLRHVVFFDAGRTEWKEFDSSSAQKVTSNLANARIYFTNAFKTIMNVAAKGAVADLYGYAFVTRNTTAASATKITFDNAFTTGSLDFRTAGYDSIEVLFDGETERNTLSIDVLNPVLPDRVYVFGKQGNAEVDLGYIDGVEYNDIFNRLLYRITEQNKEDRYGQIKVDDLYTITLSGDNGSVYNAKIKTQYYNRYVAKIYTDTSTDVYSGGKDAVNIDGKEYYSLEIDNATYGNGVTIDPLNRAVIVDNSSYKLPTNLMIEFSNGDRKTFTEIVWDTTGIPYALTGTSGMGTNGFVPTKLLSCRTDEEDGTHRVIEYRYGANPSVRITTYDNYDAVLSVDTFTLDGDIDWNIAVCVTDRHAQEITVEDGGITKRMGEKEAESYVIDATADPQFCINQYYPEFPTDLFVTFGSEKVEIKGLSQSDWTYDKTKMKYIVQAGTPGTEGRTVEYDFIASLDYLGYRLQVRFSAFKDIKLANIGTIYGGTLYLCRSAEDGSAQKQMQQFYSYTYFNFGSASSPNWKRVPIYFSGSAYDSLSAKNEKTYEGNEAIKATLGATEGNILNQNIEFTVKVISPTLFAAIGSGRNGFVTYDYYAYARNVQNERQTSSYEEPGYAGAYFTVGAEDALHFDIVDTVYDFINGVAKVTVEYDITRTIDGREDVSSLLMNVDSRLGNDKREAKRSFVVNVPLRSYLYTDVPTGQSAVLFNKSDSGKKWQWAGTNEEDAVYWPLGMSLTASDMPLLRAVGKEEMFSAYWDLGDVNVNLATEDGYLVRAYYFTEANKWEVKPLVIYIRKEDITDDVVEQITGNKKSTVVTKTYDGQFFTLPLDMSRLRYVREDGSKTSLSSDLFTVSYCKEGDETWSESFRPVNAGRYLIKVELNDYNVSVSSVSDGVLQDCILLTLVIESKAIDIDKLVFINQDGNVISYYYSGNRIPLAYTDWFTSADEKETLYAAAYRIYRNEEEAKASVYDVVYGRSDEAEKGYLSALTESAEKDLSARYEGWNEKNDDLSDKVSASKKALLRKAWVYDKLEDCCLPEVEVDGWFATESEKESLYRAYMNGNGSGVYEGVLLDETEAKAVAYTVVYSRVNDSMKAVMAGWYKEIEARNPRFTESEIRAAVYTEKMPAQRISVCEVNLRVVYLVGGIPQTTAPVDVGTYDVVVSVEPDENYGNYYSLEPISRTYMVVKDTSLYYEIMNTDVAYNGTTFNPDLTHLVTGDGNLPYGVTVTYVYNFVRDEVPYTLVIVRDAEKAVIDRARSTDGLTQNGIRDVGEYEVTVSVDGGNNFIGTTSEDYTYPKTFTVHILPADVFIELEDVDAYYLSEVADLNDYIRIRTADIEPVCPVCGAVCTVEQNEQSGGFSLVCSNCVVTENGVDGPLKMPIRLSNLADSKQVYGGGSEFVCASCLRPLAVMRHGLYYCMVCPECDVEMRVEFSHGTTVCMCDDCVTRRENGEKDYSFVEESGDADGLKEYTVSCAQTGVRYFVTLNVANLLGTETIANLGEPIVHTDVQSYYPVGTYDTEIRGIRLKGATDAYTMLTSETYAQAHPGEETAAVSQYGDFVKLALLSSDYPASLYNNTANYASILQLFRNYNIYVKPMSSYTLSPEEGAIVVTGDEELKEVLYGLEDGDDVVIYLAPGTYDKIEIGVAAQKDSDGNFVYDNDRVLTKTIDANVTLVGYYNEVTKDIETILRGITVRRGALTLKIIALESEEEGGCGLDVRKAASAVKVYETLFAGKDDVAKTTGIRTEYGYAEKVYVEGCDFIDLGTAIVLEGGNLEINGSSFRRNGCGVNITSGGTDINIAGCVFENHTLRAAVRSTNSGVVILNNAFNYNKVAIEIPKVTNYDTYVRNAFADEKGVRTNGTDILTAE